MTQYVDPKTLNKDAMLGRAQSGLAWGAAPAMGMGAASASLRRISQTAKGIKKRRKGKTTSVAMNRSPQPLAPFPVAGKVKKKSRAY